MLLAGGGNKGEARKRKREARENSNNKIHVTVLEGRLAQRGL